MANESSSGDTVTLAHPRYAPGEVLGRGAEGVVMRVTDREAPERPLVAKVWSSGRFPPAGLRGEFALLSRLALPGVVRVHDLAADSETNAPFLVEDYVAGPDATRFVNEAPEEERNARVRHVLAGALRALVGLHDAGFLHADLKPAHVKLESTGEVVLLDLGAAALAAAGTTVGTTGYLAPELLAGGRATVASDLYALGALAFRVVTGEPPEPGSRALRRAAPWLDAGARALVESLLALHPRDRPADAGAALALLGAVDTPYGARAARGLADSLWRKRELAELEARRSPGVVYVTGPSGSGKSHLGRELWARALLAGQSARRVTFPHLEETLAGRLVAHLRGERAAWPFGELEPGAPFLLVLDALELAPSDLLDALEAFRCRAPGDTPLEIVALTREAPKSAPAVALAPLSNGDFRAIAATLGFTTPDALEVATRVCRGNPGWLLALRGGAPLTREMVLERVQALGAAARDAVAMLALAGGDAEERLLRQLLPWPERGSPEGLTQACAAGLVLREQGQDGVSYRLAAPALGAELAELASFENVDQVARALLADPEASARRLLAVAGAPCPPERREELLDRAARAARSSGLRNHEIDALLGLLARAEQRSPALLLRLERLLRDAGAPVGHPELYAWLEQATLLEPALAPLVKRRAAERAARSGDAERADALILEAHARASELGDDLGRGLVFASAGAVALYRADWPRAERELAEARATLARVDGADPEELARLEHNAGVVELYAERFEPAVLAFERSLGIKRSLGDRGGVRACLLNLGLALTRLARFPLAEAVLTEAIALARSLKHAAGEAWCLAARVDLELRRGDARAAEYWLEQAAPVRAAAPAQVGADLELARAQVALLDGDAERALELTATLPAELLRSDGSLAAKAHLVEAEALLGRLPRAPRRAARLAARALRAARSASLAELEARARALLAEARPGRGRASPSPSGGAAPSNLGWTWLERVAAGLDAEAAYVALCALFVSETRAERAFLGVVGAEEALHFARGADLEGFELPNAAARFEAGFLRQLLGSKRSVYQREVGAGSRLGAHAALPSGARVVLLVEHRFRVGHFDALDTATLERWLTLARLALRITAPEHSVALRAESANPVSDTSTREPIGRKRRLFPEIIGQSAVLEQALHKLDAAIDSRLPVLIQGETGTGKELFARALHERGARAGKPFVAVNCAAIAANLFEAELFGHARGAFTGAERQRGGLVAEAEGGTLLLDEIGELEPTRQAALLRLLETGRYRPVGGDGERQADVRIVAATNRDLEREVERGTFRRDLLFRLNVLEIRVPSLRARAGDLPLLVRELTTRAGSPCRFSDAALAQLAGYEWPGNVRELEHLLSRLSSHGAREIDVMDLPRALRRAVPYSTPPADEGDPSSSQRAEVEQALAFAGGNITRAAQALGLTRHGLKKRMLRLGLRTRGVTNDG